jgi:glycosyltransferase involved in cell wall biosynthesis
MAVNLSIPQAGTLTETAEPKPTDCMNVKAALLTNCIPPYWVSTFSNLAQRVREFRIFLSTPMEADRDWKPQWGDLAVTVQKCWTYATKRWHELGFSDEVWRHIPYDTLPILLRHRPDVVISAQLGFRTLQAAIYRKFFPKTRLVVWTPLSEHSEKGLSAFRTLQRKSLLGVVDAALVNGTSGRRYLLSLGVPHEKIFPLPYCADIEAHLRVPLKRDASTARRFLYVGQLVERKGLLPFLRVLTEWLRNHPAAEIEFWIAGEGPLREELQEFPACSQLRLRFLRSVAYEKLPDVYALGGIMVFPTLADEWGVVVNESMAAGLPVLGSRYSQAVEELVTDGVTGWTFRPDQGAEVYAAVDRAMSTSDSQLEDMRRMTRKRIQVLQPEFGAECFLRAARFAYAL